MSLVSMRRSFILACVLIGCGEPADTPKPLVAVAVGDLVPGVAGTRIDVELANLPLEMSGGWQGAEWDPAGFGFVWLDEGPGAIQLPAPLAETAVVRMRVRAAGPGQKLALSGGTPTAVGERWEVLEFDVAGREDGVLEFVAEQSFRLAGDERSLAVAVDWLEVVPAGAGRIVDRTVALDIGSAAARDELGTGWGANEGNEVESWVWTVEKEATTTLSAAGGALELDLRVRPFRWEGADPAVLGVRLNDGDARELPLEDGWGVYRLRFDASEVRAGDNQLVLVPSPSGSPEALGVGNDARELGVAVDRIRVALLSRPIYESGGWSLSAGQTLVWKTPMQGDWTLTAEGSVTGTCISQEGERLVLDRPRLTIGAACAEMTLTAVEDGVRVLQLEASND
ncbi:MAG: hypothetical protein KC912_05820 [Proteobacteria bacterium]|nr:hypothetical protein [Pseudomonadota bacterium]